MLALYMHIYSFPFILNVKNPKEAYDNVFEVGIEKYIRSHPGTHLRPEKL